LYGNAASLELKRGGLGTCTVIDVPWHDADAGSEASDLTSDDDLGQDARAVAAIPSFLADSWLGRLRRVAIMGGTVWLWYYWAQRNVHGDVASALRRGLHDKSVYALVDGILCATFVVAALHVAARCARRWQLFVTTEKLWRSARRPLVIGIACALVAGVSFVLMKILLLMAFHYTALLDPGRLLFNVPRSVRGVAQTFLMTWVAAQAYYATLRGQRTRVRRTRLNEQLDDARRRRAEAELRALKSELNPHFIGNAFTAVSVLMRTDPPTASRIIDQLSDLLRAAVDRAGTQEVTLREELDSLKPFLDVQRLGLGRELAVSLNVDEETLGGQVPHMILQPLVENAVKHGLVGRDGGRIEVGAHRTPHFLELTIRDDGLGLADVRSAGSIDLPHRGGVGLANARARLAKLYGPSATLELADGPDGGAVARVMIPWHDADAARPPAEPRGTLHLFTSPASGAGVAGSP
jgi:signal transduction histidine kinase